MGTGSRGGSGVRLTGEAQDLQGDTQGKQGQAALKPLTPVPPVPSPLCTPALRWLWATGTLAPPAAQSARQCCLFSDRGSRPAAPRTAAQLCLLVCGQEYKLQGALWPLGVPPGSCLRLWCVPDMTARAGPLEAWPEVVEVSGAEGAIFGSIKLSEKVSVEVWWS